MNEGNQKSPSRLVITVHGIRTYGAWQERLETLLAKESDKQDIHVVNYKYGYFSFIGFIIPIFRWLIVRIFRNELIELCEEKKWHRIDLVGHSFGTHLISWALCSIPANRRPHIHTIIFAGSVLNVNFPWRNLTQRDVNRVVNDCGSKDLVLLINQLLVLFTGMAGRIGFSGATHNRFRNRFFAFGHSRYFTDDSGNPSDDWMRQHWLPVLLQDDDIDPVDFRSPPSVFEGILNTIANNAEPIKLVTYIAPLVIALYWIFGLFIAAENGRNRALVSQSQFLADLANRYVHGSAPNIGAQLALEALPDIRAGSTRPYVTEAEASLYAAYYAMNEILFLPCEGTVNQVSFSSDGKLIVTASSDGYARIWNATNGAVVNAIKAHKSKMASLAVLSPDGLRLATGSHDTFAKLWDPSTGMLISLLAANDGWIRHIEFSQDGKKVLVVSSSPFKEPPFESNHLIQVFDARTGVLLTKLDGHDHHIMQAIFSPDGRFVVSAMDDATAIVWDVTTGQQKQILQDGRLRNSIKSLQYSPDGRFLLTSASNGPAILWNAATGKIRAAPAARNAMVTHAAFSPDGKWLSTTSGLGDITFFDISEAMSVSPDEDRYFELTSDHVVRIRKERIDDKSFIPSQINAISFLQDSKRFLVASRDGLVRLYDVANGFLLRTFKGHQAAANAIAIDPTSRRFVTSSNDHSARVWRMEHPDEIILFPPVNHSDEIVPTASGATSLALNRDGSLLATASEKSKIIQVWDLKASGPVVKFSDHYGPVTGVVFLSDTIVASIAGVRGDDDNMARLFDISERRLLTTISGTRGPYHLIASNSNQRLLALVESVITERTKTGYSSRSGNTILLLDASNGFTQHALKGHALGVNSIKFNGDGSLLASTSVDRTTRIWDTNTGELHLTLRGHTASVTDAAFSPDGKWVATSSQDQTVRSWSVENGELQRIFTGHAAAVASVAFSSDGRYLVSTAQSFVGNNQEFIVWDAMTGQRIILARPKEGGVGTLARFSADGRRLLVLGTRNKNRTGKYININTAQVWDIATNKAIFVIDNISEQAVALNERGNRLVVGLTDGTVHVYRLFGSTQELIDAVKNSISKCMNVDERKAAFLNVNPPTWCQK